MWPRNICEEHYQIRNLESERGRWNKHARDELNKVYPPTFVLSNHNVLNTRKVDTASGQKRIETTRVFITLFLGSRRATRDDWLAENKVQWTAPESTLKYIEEQQTSTNATWHIKGLQNAEVGV